MVEDLNHHFGALYNDGSVRVVVIRGNGKAFCAGLDLKEHHDRGEVPFGGGFNFQGYLADVYIKARCGAQDTLMDIVVPGELLPQSLEFLDHLAGGAVHRLGSVDRDRRDVVGDFEQNGLVGHA